MIEFESLVRSCARACLVAGFVAIGSTAAAAAGAATPAGAVTEIEILHTNDLHGYLRPGFAGKGGAGAIAAKVAAARERARTDPNYDVLVVDAGDLFGGGAEDNFSRGEMMTEFVLGVGYDAYVPGNHDFGYGLPILTGAIARFRAAGIRVLGSNIQKEGTSVPASPVASDCVVVTKKGVKIGLIGLTTPGTGRMNLDENVAGIDFKDPIAVLPERIAKLKADGATAVIVVSHVGLENDKYADDKKTAKAVPGIHAIIGGHSHTAMDHEYVEPTNKTVIVQAGAQCKFIGSLKLRFDAKTGKPLERDGVIDHEYQLIELASLSGSHPLADKLKAKYWDPIQAKLDETVGTSQIGLYRKFYKAESALGDLLADGILKAAPGCQLAISATSELRADLRKGDIKQKDVFETVPFDNEIVKVAVKGSLLRDLVDSVYGDGRHFLNLSGAKVVVDSRKPEGQRVISFKIGGVEVEPGGTYQLATTDFVVQGKGGFTQFTHPAYEHTHITNRDALVSLIKKAGTITDNTIEMQRLRDEALSKEIGRVKGTFGTDTAVPGPNLYDLVAAGIRGNPPRGELWLIDTSSIHWKLSEKYPVTKGDLFELASYDNKVVTAPVTGEQLSSMFRGMVAAAGSHKMSAWIAGGHLVVHGSDCELLIGEAPVDPKKNYTLVTYDHLMTGPKGFEALGALHLPATSAGINTRAALEAWIRKASPIGPETFPGRPTVITGEPVRRSTTRFTQFERIAPGEKADEPVTAPSEHQD